MAYLNEQERLALLNELSRMDFNQARRKLRRLDSSGRLVYYRNAQEVGRLLTRYDLPSLGTRVTLVENYHHVKKDSKVKPEFQLVEVIVEPTPDNRT